MEGETPASEMARAAQARADALLASAGAGLSEPWSAAAEADRAILALRLAALRGEEQLDGARAGLLEARERLRQRLIEQELAPEEVRELERLATQDLGEVDARSLELASDTTGDPRAMAAELGWLVERCMWLETVLKRLQPGASSLVPLEVLFAELLSLRRRLPELERDEELARRLGDTYDRALIERTQQVSGPLVTEGSTSEQAASLWARLRDVDGARVEVLERMAARGEGILNAESGALLASSAERLSERLGALIREAPASAREGWIARWARELLDHSQDVLSVIDDLPLSQAILRLRLAREEIAQLRHLSAGLVRWPGPLIRPRRDPLGLYELSALDHRLRREIQEKRLAERMERLLGRGQVALLENTVLILIVVVIAQLLYELLGDPTPRTLRTLDRVDAVICLVFLLEFGLRLTLASERWLYLRAHFLTDLLPSIPFGFLVTQLQALDIVRGGRLMRLGRLPHLMRYVRVARPLVRMTRVIGFLVQGVDRAVRSHAGLLNRNVVAFAPPEGRRASELGERLARAHARSREVEQQVLAGLEPAQRRALALGRLEDLDARLAAPRDAGFAPRGSNRAPAAAREIRLERVLDHLTQLTGTDVELALGHESVLRFARAIRLFQAPGIRRLPLLAAIARVGARTADPYEAVAEVGRLLGAGLQRLLNLYRWAADLCGTVTATQLVGMVGLGLVRATTQPAKRLITFGGLLLLLNWTVTLFDLPWLQRLSVPLERIVGLPLVIMGSACLVFLVLGQWLRRISGEASDFYKRTAEAQFLSLLKVGRLERLRPDVAAIYQRVIAPEERLIGEGGEGELGRDPEEALTRLEVALQSGGVASPAELAISGGEGAEAPERGQRWLLEHQVLNLLRDYFDGALLHQTDVKTTNQLLGNLTVRQIIEERLELPARERKQLKRLDLQSGGLFGPYLWFHLLTLSAAQRTAKLILEYNRYAIPLDEMPFVSAATRQASEAWLASDQRDPARQAPAGDTVRGYPSTEFTALNFLSTNQTRDQAILELYGERVLARLQEDRRLLMRNLFGTYPASRLPLALRSFNPYSAYHRYLAQGQILVFPFRLLFWSIGLAWLGLRAFTRVASQLLDPHEYMEAAGFEAGFDVAERKIERMRRPVYMEAAQLRARFDAEYLGLALPGFERPLAEDTCWADLDQIEATESERELFRELRADRQEGLRRLARWLEQEEAEGRGLAARLQTLRPGLARRPGEALRALATAYAIDYEGLRSHLTGAAEVEAVWQGVLERPERLQRLTLRRRLRLALGSAWRSRCGLRPDPLRAAFRNVLARTRYAEATPAERGQLFRAVLEDVGGCKQRVERGGALAGSEASRRRVEEIVERILLRPHPWTSELVALRTIQTMSVLDLRNYKRLVWELGGYAADEPERSPPD